VTPLGITRKSIVNVARSYLDVPWRHMGRSKTGMDCVGLPYLVALALGIDAQDYPEPYRREPDNAKLTRFLATQLEQRRPPLKIGMVLALRDTVQPCHIGILSSKNGVPHLIHASVYKRMVVEEPYARWAPLFYCAFDFPGIIDV
jgi:cell wall-associated NlpC family hydrolase